VGIAGRASAADNPPVSTSPPVATTGRQSAEAFAATFVDADSTVAADTLRTQPDAPPESAANPTQTRRTTVLPRVQTVAGEVRLVHQGRTRYQTERVLGEGGMGTVDLARDHDIDRRIAIKRLRPELAGPHGVARFTEEVRTVAQLEHPNIVPVHDVGLDEQGYFLVMKYVEGETLERIIERLAEGDPEAHRRYTFEVRVQVFISLLRALAYAHDRGIIHRDLKPANVMVGPYGEVVLMDWGIARPIDGDDLPPADAEDGAPTDDGDTRKRLVQTQGAELVGTPMYMSPEQARGEHDLDARSDLYSASVLFHELMTLGHYLHDRRTVPAVLVGVLEHELPGPMDIAAYSHRTQGPPPAEYVHFVRRGMAKDPAARWSSAHEMIAQLEAALEGRVHVQCPVTMSKRMTREMGRFVDRHPKVVVWSVFGLAAAVVGGSIAGVLALVL
jgi:serine/threonine protein kinase